MPKVLDDFEDGDIAEWAGDTGSFSVSTSPVYSGSYAVTTTSSSVAITRTDVSIAPGETPFGAWHYTNNYEGGLGTVYGNTSGPVFAVPSQTGYSNLSGYAIEGRYGGDSSTNDLHLVRFDSGSRTDLAAGPSVPVGEYYECRWTQWTSAGDITIEFYDTAGNFEGSVSVTDDTYGAGHIGYQSGSGDTTVAGDYYFKPTTLTAPTNVHFNDTTTEDQLTLDWDAASGANGYYVYRAQASGSTKSDYTQIAHVTSGTTYTDTSLEDGEKYYYRVSSHD